MQCIVGILDHAVPEGTQAKLYHGPVVENLDGTKQHRSRENNKNHQQLVVDFALMNYQILSNCIKKCVQFINILIN
jgi:hypothetical protein